MRANWENPEEFLKDLSHGTHAYDQFRDWSQLVPPRGTEDGHGDRRGAARTAGLLSSDQAALWDEIKRDLVEIYGYLGTAGPEDGARRGRD